MPVTASEDQMDQPIQNNGSLSFTVLILRRLGLLAVAAALGLANPPAAGAADCDPPPAGIIGWWPGQGNATNVAGTNGLNGTLQGGATATNAGMVGQCLGFNGTTAYVSIADDPALHPTNFTIETWVNFSSLDSTGNSLT